MNIRAEQNKKLADALHDDFEKRVCQHLAEYFPDQCAALGNQGVADEVKYGIRRASVNGFTIEADVCRYIDLMFTFGSDFDCDDTLPWVKNAIQEKPGQDPTMRMDSMFADALAYLEET